MRDRAVGGIDVVVVGGGIAGLAAAHALVQGSGPGLRVTVLEATASVGGKLRQTEVGGRIVDAGAESMLARRPEGLAFSEAVGLGDQIEHPMVEGAAVWTRGGLRALPRGLVMGIPTDLRALAASQVLSWRGLLRIPLDHVRRPTPVDGDVAIGSLVAARVGREVVDRLVEPMLGGVYAGHADEISLDAALPQLASGVRVERSLLTAAARQAASQVNAGPLFATVRGGLGRLPAVVTERLRADGVEIRTASTVRELSRTADGGWQLVVGETRTARRIQADAVVLAVPATTAARLLARVVPTAATDLAGIEYASVAIVTAVLPDHAGLPSGTGFLAPPAEGLTVKAATFSSSKWEWVRAQDPTQPVVRMSIGRHREEGELHRSDDELAAVALADLARVTGYDRAPVDVVVTRWGGALPQYAVGHVNRVDRIRDAVEAVPGLAVCGAAYDGVGVPACIASAERAAGHVLRGLGERRQWGHG